MDTSNLDKWLVEFLEANGWLIMLILVPIALLQVYWYLTKEPPTFLHPDIYQDMALQKKENVNHNTIFLRFKLEDARQRLGLLVGQHAIFKFTDKEGQAVIRPYTPVTGINTKGHVDFIIKVYPGGEMSQYVDKLDIGDRILVKGPKGKFVYRRNMKKAFGEFDFFPNVHPCLASIGGTIASCIDQHAWYWFSWNKFDKTTSNF